MSIENMSKFPDKVRVRVWGTTYGPHTRTFGLRIQLLLQDKRSFSITYGEGGNNSNRIGDYLVALPVGFEGMSKVEQARILRSEIERLGCTASFVARDKELAIHRTYEDWNGLGPVELGFD